MKIEFIDDLISRSFGNGAPLTGGEAKFYGTQGGETHAGLHIACPGCKQIIGVQFIVAAGPRWHWDGNVEAPTVTPSIHHIDCWHGFLTKGEFISC